MRRSLALLATYTVLAASPETFRVSGTVVDSETGAPLNRTRMTLTGGPATELSLVTTSDGAFSFDVPQGKYTLIAAHRDWGHSYGQLDADGGADTSIITGPDQDTAHIVFRWRAPASIYGKVTDETGEPVYNPRIELIRVWLDGGRKRLVAMGQAESDEFGEYSWSSLPAGSYYLAVSGGPWYFSHFLANDRLSEAGTPPSPYAPVYFPGVTDPRGATLLTLRPGEEAHLDFTMRAATGANLRFLCPDTPCSDPVRLYLSGPGGVEMLGRTVNSGFDAMRGVLPGQYVVRYTASEGSTRKVIDVAGGDVEVKLAPKPAPVVTGSVKFLRGHPRHPVLVSLLDEKTGEALTTQIEPDGAFGWRSVAARRVHLVLSGEDGFFIDKMVVDGAPVNHGVIALEDGDAVNVQLVASDAIGGIQGMVTDGDRPIPTASVILVPSSQSIGLDSYAFQTDSDGSFDFTQVPEGDYVLFAVENEEFEYANPGVVRPYLASGKRVHIVAHQTRKENLKLAPPQGK